jgi:hypothetical protein
LNSAPGGVLLRLDQGSLFNGNFDPGTHLLWTGINGGPLDIKFQSGVGEVGLGVQSSTIGAHTFTVTAYEGAAAKLMFTVPGNSFVSFIGVAALNGEAISELLISEDDNDIVFGPLTFGTPSPVPEPASLTMLGIGAISLMGYGLRRRRKVAHS